MRLYFFRASSDIPVKGMEEVAEMVGRVFRIDYSVFAGPIVGEVDDVAMEHLLKVSDHFLVRNEPVVAIVFTLESVDDRFVDVLGEASQLDRGAWVKWSDDLNRVVVTVVHELGHLCEAYHCANESCVMFYAYREHSKLSFDDLFCEKCKAIVKTSWVYNRLVQASEDRAKKGRKLQKVVDSTPLNLTGLSVNSVQSSVSGEDVSCSGVEPFPDWTLASKNKEEFIRRVKKHFECEKKKY